MNITIDLRSHEQRQLNDYLPRVKSSLEAAEMDDDAINAINVAHKRLSDGELGLDVDDWGTVLTNLHRAEDSNRLWWLRTKL